MKQQYLFNLHVCKKEITHKFCHFFQLSTYLHHVFHNCTSIWCLQNYMKRKTNDITCKLQDQNLSPHMCRVGGSKFFIGGTTNKKNEILQNFEEFGNFYSINPQKDGGGTGPLLMFSTCNNWDLQ